MHSPKVKDFLAEHQQFFEKQESKYNIILGLALQGLKRKAAGKMRLYSFGRPGAAAVHTEGRNLVIGDLCPEECAKLASHFSDISYPGFIASDPTCDWFLSAAGAENFHVPVRQGIFQLDGPPKKPPVAGKLSVAEDTYLVVKWMSEFHDEVEGHGAPSREHLKQRAGRSPFYFWLLGGEPVAMAGIVREGIKGSTIGAVFVPPEHRGHRYGEAITAAVAAEILKSGKAFSNLYADEANPISNKIYDRIGYRLLCGAKSFRRKV